MNPQQQTNGAQTERIAQALAYADASMRLKAALAAGSDPDPALAPRLVERCGVEPDFFVRRSARSRPANTRRDATASQSSRR